MAALLPVHPPTSSDTLDPPTSPISTTLADDIDASIQRGAVEPGTGARRVEALGQTLWTHTDQVELDRLLAEGRDVYVPPDVDDNDLPVPRARNYSYTVRHPEQGEGEEQEQEEPTNEAVDNNPNHLSIKDRIAQWNQVIPEKNSPFTTVPSSSVPSPYKKSVTVTTTPTTSTTTTGQDAVENQPFHSQNISTHTHTPTTHADVTASRDHLQTIHHNSSQQQQQGDSSSSPTSLSTSQRQFEDDSTMQQPLHHSRQNQPDNQQQQQQLPASPESKPLSPSPSPSAAKPRRGVDVTMTIFGGTFLTVPVVSKKAIAESNLQQPSSPSPSPSSPSPHPRAAPRNVELRCDSTAQVDVVADYGLCGGHSSVVHDATFVHKGQKLVTCGNDGKVCIWDMMNGSVQYEFIPYDGEPVTMIYPLDNDDDEEEEEEGYTLITLSQSRLLRIWLVDGQQAIMLRNSPIKDSHTDLYMTVTPISAMLRKKAIAAAAAAAVTTTDSTPVDEQDAAAQVQRGTAPEEGEGEGEEEEEEEEGAFEDAREEGEEQSEEESGTEGEEEEEEEEEEERGRKRFSLTKVLSFGSRKAVAS